MSKENKGTNGSTAYGGVFTKIQLETILAVAETKTYSEADELLGVKEGTVKGRMMTLRKKRRTAINIVNGFNNLIKRYPELKKLLEYDRR